MPISMLPGVEQPQEPEQRPIRWTIPQRVDRFQERERQGSTQRRLLERLRYKGYVRRGTLGTVIQQIGNTARSKWVRYLILALTYLYFLRRWWLL